MGPWTYGRTFHLGEYQENHSSGNFAFTGSWTRAAWTPASDGYLSVSERANSTVMFEFTGSSVAWIATKATNRGQARVYLDGTYVRTVDLYQATTTAQSIAFSHAWPEVGAHRITVQVVGTARRPKVDVDAFVRLR